MLQLSPAVGGVTMVTPPTLLVEQLGKAFEMPAPGNSEVKLSARPGTATAQARVAIRAADEAMRSRYFMLEPLDADGERSCFTGDCCGGAAAAARCK